MSDNNLVRYFVNFENVDEDGAIWFNLPTLSATTMSKIEYTPREGEIVHISDGDMEVTGVLEFRGDRFVVVPNAPYQAVEIDKPYHVNNSG